VQRLVDAKLKPEKTSREGFGLLLLFIPISSLRNESPRCKLRGIFLAKLTDFIEASFEEFDTQRINHPGPKGRGIYLRFLSILSPQAAENSTHRD
jgi:hypothetical protein